MGDDPWAGLATGSYPVVGFRELKPFIGVPGEVVVDVRLGTRVARGPSRRLPSTSRSTSCPIASRTFPPGRVWVHCAAGYRASVAGSLLARAGRDVMVVSDQFSNAVDAGLEIVSCCD